MSAHRANAHDRPDIQTAVCEHCQTRFDADYSSWLRVFAVIEELRARDTTVVRYWHPRCYGSREHFLPQPNTNVLAARS